MTSTSTLAAPKPHVLDGTVVVSADTGDAYLVESGERTPITGPETLFAAGLTPDLTKRIVLPEARLQQIPSSTKISPHIVGLHSVDSGDQFLGAGHYMHTWGSVDGSTGAIALQTRIRTVTWFGGYHGSVQAVFTNAADGPVYETQSHRYGVDGTMVGQSDLTSAWWENMGATAAAQATKVTFFHSWSPDDLQTVIGRWVAVGQALGQLLAEAASIAKTITTTF